MSAHVSSAAHLDNSPPKKKAKKSKWHATCNTCPAPSNGSQVNDSLEAPRHSGRTGAGSGGRIAQLEKIGNALSGQTKQPRTSRMDDLPDGTSANPLAPPKKGRRSAVTHQTCLVLWTWRKLADETNAKNAPKICWKIVLTWGIQTALAIHITQSQDCPYAKNEYKLVVAIYRTRMTILEQEMTADV